MDEKTESDQTLTTEEFSPEIEEDSEAPKRQRSGVFGLIAIGSSIVILLTSLFADFSGTTTVTREASDKVTIGVTLKSQEFRNTSSTSICSGTSSVPNIDTAVLRIQSTGWNEEVKLGKGEKDSSGNCLYRMKFIPPTTFKGGNITFTATFQVGNTSPVTINVGTEKPYKSANPYWNLD